VNSLKDDLKALLKALIWYIKHKVTLLAHQFEGFKNLSVNILMHRRGSLQSKVWHGSMVGLASVGVLTSGIFGGASLVSSSYPGVTAPDPRFVTAYEPFPNGSLLDPTSNGEDTHTTISQKPRDGIIDYEVESGDVVSMIAKKFGISSDTIKWANPDIDNINNLKPGQTIKILPVTGVAHTVKSGDTLETVAKKYQADAQAILDFPFNDVPDDFRLKTGQLLIVPDGVNEEAAPVKKVQPQYIAKGPSSPVFEALGGGKFVWPTTTVGISQYFAWYHPGVDLPNPSRPPVAASDGGKVVVAGWPDNYGYGNRVIIDHGNGYTSIYAHLSNIYVSVGQVVSRGQVIGQMGSTGRSTGTHLHFEIHYKGVPLNPLAILK
jgi:murein DD-endopeptidase MepM/ murein hydrolase activator NlpD